MNQENKSAKTHITLVQASLIFGSFIALDFQQVKKDVNETIKKQARIESSIRRIDRHIRERKGEK
ncbi:MAG: hypothetical protein OES84_00025 [Kiritimatiellaceae bacterium]|nr:hypothetical protein [Kiritimatiellaceae bacterium]